MSKFNSKYDIGETVKVGFGSILGVVSSITFYRNCSTPVYKVNYWHEGSYLSITIEEEEISK